MAKHKRLNPLSAAALTPVCTESLTVPVSGTDQLHLMRLYVDKRNPGQPVLLVHSIARDGSCFIGERHTGLAPYLARQGYDVYVVDLRGRGKSWPKVSGNSHYGVHQAITEDIPAVIKAIIKKHPDTAQRWIGHGWGGVLLSSYLARYGESLCEVVSMVQLGSRRRSGALGAPKKAVLNGLWRRLGKSMVWVNGYLPAKKLRLGNCNEAAQLYRDYLYWSDAEQWIDPKDNFDYGKALKRQHLPPTLYIASTGDTFYGRPEDVRYYALESGRHNGRLLRTDFRSGSLHNYSHLDLLEHPAASGELFPVVCDWLASDTHDAEKTLQPA